MTGNSISGHLRIRCDVRDDGVPYLSKQSFRAPIHLSKSHRDAGALIVTLVNPTAGFFDGDALVCEVEVGNDAKLVLSTPSSSRVFRTRTGKPAVCDQTFHVDKGGFLEWIPEAFIPHKGASYEQRTSIHLEEGASLFFIDWISPGRVARGECFEYEKLRWELDLFVSGDLVAREKYEMIGLGRGPEGITAMFESGHFISVFLSGKMVENWPKEKIEQLENDDVYMGHGGLNGEAMVLRAICRDSLAARGFVEELRKILYDSAGMELPKLGRIFM
ncbi:urease accessory protein UreD [Luteolibacter sp. AS25]|uniref:urease accessory protein UreD n=1 Tax=Luteolibacter sp. AS25 TaxID=3135776 RepID=UPI00398B8AC1